MAEVGLRPGPLVSTGWLEYRLHDEALRIIDCRFYSAEPSRGYEEYLAGHIPTAAYFSLDDDMAGPVGPGRHPLPEPEAFSARLRSAGIGNDHRVVVYDHADAGIAARLWWMLRSLGHTETYVLDGGWAAWSAEPRSTTREIPEWEPGDLSLADEWSGSIDRDQILTSGEGLFLIDARAAERYRGEEEPFDPVAGHIPGALNLPYEENTDESGHFLPIEELQARFGAISTKEPIVCYCGSGVTACNNILAMEIAGITDVLLYPGSWSDWSTSGGDVATK